MPASSRFRTSPRLVAGDLVALLAPASWAEDDWLAANVTRLESWGLRVRVGEHVRDRVGYLAGRDEARAADLNAAVADPEVRAVIALTGGCGSLRLVGAVDVQALQHDPKPLVGFSDITALHRVWHAARWRSVGSTGSKASRTGVGPCSMSCVTGSTLSESPFSPVCRSAMGAIRVRCRSARRAISMQTADF